MNATLFPAHFPQQQVRLAGQGGWAPARRPLPSEAGAASRRLGQSAEASAIAKGADITFSVLASAAAVTSGIALMTLVGAPSGGSPEGFLRAPGGRPARNTWSWVGGIIAIVGLLNAFVSLSRASATTQPPALAPTITRTPAPAQSRQ